MSLTLELVTVAHAAEIIAFEQQNRAFFAQTVPDRGDDYFLPANMDRFLAGIEAEQARGECFLYLVRGATGELVGRANLIDIKEGTATLGYRIGEAYAGRGYATEAARLVLAEAARLGIHTVKAMTTEANVGSQKVLLKVGLLPVEGRPEELEVNGVMHKALHFERQLP